MLSSEYNLLIALEDFSEKDLYRLGAIDGRALIKQRDELYKQCAYGDKLSDKEIADEIAAIISNNLQSNEVCYTDELFKEDCKKFHPSSEGKAFLHRIQSECLAGNCNTHDEEIEKWILENYGKETLQMYQSYFGKITYRVFTMVTNLKRDKHTYKYQVQLDTVGTVAHERRHATQSKEMIEISRKIKEKIITSEKDIDFEKYLTPDEIDALKVEIKAMQNFIKSLA